MIEAHRPETIATDRSISPSSSTSTTPIEIIPVAAICSDRFTRFVAVRKRSLAIVKMPQMTTRPSSTAQRAELALRDALEDREAPAGPRLGGSGARRLGLRLGRGGGCAHRAASRPNSAPVIAATTSSLGSVADVEDARAPTEPQHEDAVGDLEHVGEVVADHHDAEPLLAQPLDQREHLRGLLHAERRRRLVEQHDAPRRAASARSRRTAAGRPTAGQPPCARSGSSPSASAAARRACCSIAVSSSARSTRAGPLASSSRPRNRLATTSRLSHSARSW